MLARRSAGIVDLVELLAEMPRKQEGFQLVYGHRLAEHVALDDTGPVLAQEVLGFQAQTSLIEGLAQTIAWMRG